MMAILKISVSAFVLLLFCSCGSAIRTLSDSEIGNSNRVAQADEPSAKVLAAAVNKPKDRHSMPIYRFTEKHRVVRTTAYTCSEADHIQYGSKSAAGNYLSYKGHMRSAAADWSFYPLGTVFKMKGSNQLYVVDDYGSALAGAGTLDLYHPCKPTMNQWGRRNVEISVVRWGSFRKSVDLLKGRTKYWHCRMMLNNILRQRPDLRAYTQR